MPIISFIAGNFRREKLWYIGLFHILNSRIYGIHESVQNSKGRIWKICVFLWSMHYRGIISTYSSIMYC